MRFLVTNDDGYGKEGIRALEEAALTLSDDVWVIAPHVEQSGKSHALTFKEPYRVHERSSRKRFTVEGTPTDCVLCGVHAIMKETPPDFILSGANHGWNIAEDIGYSGTVGAAIEGTCLGIPSIAFSQAHTIDAAGKETGVNFECARRYAADILKVLIKVPFPKDVLFNVNFPGCIPQDVRGIKVVPTGRRRIGSEINLVCLDKECHEAAFVYNRSDECLKGVSDLYFIRKNFITVTPIRLDQTCYETIPVLHEAFRS